ncbi:CPBP family intramembrane metalloprotease [Altererythrobacter salegens]|uniref:CPBP family intramembrane metalloprotease n=1 Tax=Croceibacterium salegens TaxID=1737568 RepID=A0A6I4SYI9_9SPHN|nr:CPBP family glutamic-type intramembrane protease [Croceibacterium salegens]MXO61184.1 CPBP family intramembrane metalloprotease [Croceibacterium salegens]
MTGQATSLERAGVWRRFGGFVCRPDLPPRASGISGAAFAVLGKLFVLDLLLMATLIGLAALAEALGAKFPGHLLTGLEMSPPIIALIVLGAPIAEETVFRGWLSGRPGHVLAVLLLLGGGIAFTVLSGGGREVAALAAPVIAFVLAIAAIWWKRRSDAMGFFQRHFRWFYWGSALAFGSVHLTNFTSGNALILLPLTLPQLLLGLILGYARTRFGLWSSMLMHAAHNTLFISLVLFGGG